MLSAQVKVDLCFVKLLWDIKFLWPSFNSWSGHWIIICKINWQVRFKKLKSVEMEIKIGNDDGLLPLESYNMYQNELDDFSEIKMKCKFLSLLALQPVSTPWQSFFSSRFSRVYLTFGCHLLLLTYMEGWKHLLQESFIEYLRRKERKYKRNMEPSHFAHVCVSKCLSFYWPILFC